MISPLAMRERYGFEPSATSCCARWSSASTRASARSAGRAHQRRPREQSRQPREPHAQHGGAASRRRGARARRGRGPEREVQAAAARARARASTRCSATQRVPPRARGDLPARRRREPLPRRDARPGRLAKDAERQRRARRTALYTSCEALRAIALLLGRVPARDRGRAAGAARTRGALASARFPRRCAGAGCARARRRARASRSSRASSAARPSPSRCGSTATATSPPTRSAPTATPCWRARAQAGVEAFVAIGSGYGIAANAARRRARRGGPARVRGVGVHPHEAKQLDDAGPREQLARLARRVRAWWRSASAASTTTTCTRRATCSARSSPSRSRWRASAICPVSIHVRGDDDGCLRRAARHLARRGTRRARGRAALLHRHARVRAARARRGPRRLVLRHPHLQARTAACATSPRRCRSSACWSRPTRRCSRPKATAASATSRALGRPVGETLARVRGVPVEEVARRHRRATRGACSASPSRRAGGVSETGDVLGARGAARARGGRDPARALRDAARDRARRAPRSISSPRSTTPARR